MHNINKLFPFVPISDIKNIYTFEIIDENNNVIDKQTYTNLTMSKRYFQKNVSNLKLMLGTMLPNDYKKYQSNGKWKKGWAVHYEDGTKIIRDDETWEVDRQAQVEVTAPDGSTRTIDTGNYYSFDGKVTENDTSLWGTTAATFDINWECENFDSNGVTLRGETEWGYHSINYYCNQNKAGAKIANKDTGKGSRGNSLKGTDKVDPYTTGTEIEPGVANLVEQGTYWRSDPIYDIEYMIAHQGETEYTDWYEAGGNTRTYVIGISICDGGYFANGAGMLSHFKCGLFKRPVEKVHIFVQSVFKVIPLDSFGTPFLKEGNLLYAHSLNNSNKGTPQFKPTTISLSSYPVVGGVSKDGSTGIIPILGNGPSLSLTVVETDKPNTWDDNVDGEWFGFPQYGYYGENDFYETSVEQVKTGVDKDGNPIYKDKEIDNKNDLNQKIFKWDQLEEKQKIILEQSSFGPVRSIVADGFSATNGVGILDELIPGKVTEIKIGTGNGSMKKFYHPFTSENGIVTAGYWVKGNQREECKPLQVINRYYDISSNPFSTLDGFQGIYGCDSKYHLNEYGIKICDAADVNKIINYNYSKKDKWCKFSKHPFVNAYFPCGRGILSKPYGMVYQYNGVITAGWVGMIAGVYINADLYFRTASSIDDLFEDNKYASTSVGANSAQHAQSTLNFQSRGYVLIYGGEDWNQSSLYMGGLRFNAFDQAGVRISSNGEISGYIEFEEAPPQNAAIYIDANITKPFLHYFNTYSSKIVFQFAEEDDNGTEIIDFNDSKNW